MNDTSDTYSISSLILPAEKGCGDARAVLDWVIREGLSDWVAFEQKVQ